MPDLVSLLREDYQRYEDDIRSFAGQLREQRKVLGPRQRKRLRQHILNQPIEESLTMIEGMYARAGHQPGERVPCAACRFLGEGEQK